jgi:hypothetical protein
MLERRAMTLQDIRAWFDLQRETIERVHPSWLPSIDPDLVIAARQSTVGRRWLANQLTTINPLLFALPRGVGPGCVQDLQPLGWFTTALRQATDCALDLGALALAPRLRTVITRPAVTQIRTTLGQDRYERALAAPIPGPTLPPDDVTSLLEEILPRGAHELAEHAAQLHPALAESVKLTFDSHWWDSPATPTLPPEIAADCLQRRVPHD